MINYMTFLVKKMKKAGLKRSCFFINLASLQVVSILLGIKFIGLNAQKNKYYSSFFLSQLSVEDG